MLVSEKYLWTNHSRDNPAPFFGGKGRGKNALAGQTFLWTNHVKMKMGHYRLTEARVKRIIRHPARIEEGILEGGIACMQPAGGKQYSEIWALYVLVGIKDKSKKIKIITAWRYPGRSPSRDPIPPEVLQEIKGIL